MRNVWFGNIHLAVDVIMRDYSFLLFIFFFCSPPEVYGGGNQGKCISSYNLETNSSSSGYIVIECSHESYIKENLKNGAFNGTWNVYYDNDKGNATMNRKLKTRGGFKDGNPHGIHVRYYWSGEIQEYCEFDNGIGILKGYHEDGTVGYEAIIKNGEMFFE